MERWAPASYFRGTISTVNPASVLNPFVDPVHDAPAQGRRQGRARRLHRAGVLQLLRLQELHLLDPEIQSAADKQYRLRFISSPARKWQRTSLLALSCYGVNSVSME